MKHRVVITGMAGVTALGNHYQTIIDNMQQQQTAIRQMKEWGDIAGLHTQLAAPISNFILPEHYERKKIRSMGRVAQLATVATERALSEANLLNSSSLSAGNIGIAYGSCSGSTGALADLVTIQTEKSIKHVTATTYLKAMSHTCAVNLALFFNICGRLIPTASACTSSSQALGYAYEAIKHGYQDVMIAGGAEELCVTQAAIFDTLFATSQQNSQPHLTPRPFDKNRDGLVLGEGSCTLILESLEHAQERGAPIYAEIVGFATNCDAVHITQPTAAKMQIAIEKALDNAQLQPEQIGYINAHGTATERGDIAETEATYNVFGSTTPISSFKSYFGHTLGACGAIEAWLSIMMMQQNSFMPTINLTEVDVRCAPLDYIMQQARVLDCDYIMSNNFAFGGINTSLIFKKFKN